MGWGRKSKRKHPGVLFGKFGWTFFVLWANHPPWHPNDIHSFLIPYLLDGNMTVIKILFAWGLNNTKSQRGLQISARQSSIAKIKISSFENIFHKGQPFRMLRLIRLQFFLGVHEFSVFASVQKAQSKMVLMKTFVGLWLMADHADSLYHYGDYCFTKPADKGDWVVLSSPL